MPDDTDTSPFIFTRKGILFILSAPSGAGKTTLSRQILAREYDLLPSVSYTTRTPRPGERDGQDYHFVDEAHFTQLRAASAFAEWAQVHDYLYGTARAPIEETVTSGRDILLDIDVQGARQIKSLYVESVSIFVLPPSWPELEQRLRSRGTDPNEVIARRLQRARSETQALGSYDYLIVNDQIDRAVAQLAAIIQAERSRISRISAVSSPLLSAILHASQKKGGL